MPKVNSTPAFAMLMVSCEVLNSAATSLTTLKNTVLLKHAESVIQLVAKTIMHLRQKGKFTDAGGGGAFSIFSAVLETRAFSIPILVSISMNGFLNTRLST